MWRKQSLAPWSRKSQRDLDEPRFPAESSGVSLGGMTSHLRRARDFVRTQLWPIPTIAVIIAVLMGLSLPKLDASNASRLSGERGGWLFAGDAEAARSLLAAISGSLITVTALTFSLTVVTLQLASSQFSPRLLRTFTRDRFVQFTLALFLATFTYALTVLRSIRGAGEDSGAEAVPQLAVSVAFVLTVASVVALVLFLAHLTKQIRVETMLHQVHRDAIDTMRSVLTERDPARGVPPSAPLAPPGSLEVLARGGGFLTRISQDDVLQVAVEEDVVLSLDVYPGCFVVAGTPVGSAWSRADLVLDDDTKDRIATRVGRCLHFGFERTSDQDVGFGLRQMTDVANKALSPGVNDPTTAIHALGHISAFLCELAGRDLGPEVLRDRDGLARVVLRRPDLALSVDLGISQPRRYGAADPQVLEKILQVLLDLSHNLAPDQRPVVSGQLRRLRATALSQAFDNEEETGLDALSRRIEATLHRNGAQGDIRAPIRSGDGVQRDQ